MTGITATRLLDQNFGAELQRATPPREEGTLEKVKNIFICKDFSHLETQFTEDQMSKLKNWDRTRVALNWLSALVSTVSVPLTVIAVGGWFLIAKGALCGFQFHPEILILLPFEVAMFSVMAIFSTVMTAAIGATITSLAYESTQYIPSFAENSKAKFIETLNLNQLQQQLQDQELNDEQKSQLIENLKSLKPFLIQNNFMDEEKTNELLQHLSPIHLAQN